MTILRPCAPVWLLFLVAGALPARVAPAMSQTPERARSPVLLTPRTASSASLPSVRTTALAPAGAWHAPSGVRRDSGGAGARDSGRASGWNAERFGATYRGPDPWIAAPVALAWLITLDLAINEWSQTSWQGDFGDGVARFGDILGEGEIMIFVSGGSLFVGALEGPDGLKRASAVIAGVLAGPINNAALKLITGRARPNETDNPLDFQPFSGGNSFPSGHVSVPFSIAGALEAATGSEAIAYPFYFAGALTGFARMYDNAHWFSDVVASAIIASIVSRKATEGVLKAWGLEPGLGRGMNYAEAGDPRLRHVRPTGVRATLLATGTTLGVQLTF
jgi:membrane-associated phospholipid phosphatase